MKKLNFLFALGVIVLLSCQAASAGIKIPLGNLEVLTKVADLPDTEDYMAEDGKYVDLATLHEEFNIAYILPLYIEKEPRLVGYNESEDTYYDFTDEQLTEILTANNLNGDELNKVGFYSRYGGKFVALLLIALIVWGIIPSRKGKEEKEEPAEA